MKKFILIIVLLPILVQLNAQNFHGKKANAIIPNASFVKRNLQNKKIEYIRFDATAMAQKSISADINPEKILNTPLGFEFKIEREFRDRLGEKHVRYRQYYNGIPVEGMNFTYHFANKQLKAANGYYSNLAPQSAMQALDQNQCFELAKKEVPSEKYEFENNPTINKKRLAELVYLEYENHLELCYKIDIYSLEPLARYYVYVSTQTGKVLKKLSRIHNVDREGTAVTLYSDTVSITADSLAGQFRLRESGRGGGIVTLDLNNGTSYTSAVDFTDTDNFWDETTNFDNAAYDAHAGTEATYDYYLNEHGRDSYDDLGSVLTSYVHYSSGYVNAFWNGSVMTYGDGDGLNYFPLTCTDITAHEITHGVTEYTAGLEYSYESGALNESFSDIFGVCVDFYMNPSTANWLMGEQISSSGTPIRSMEDPNSQGNPDTYLGDYWWASSGDNGGVHTNSGVQNYWFYLLAQGGSGTNDLGNSYSVGGIGIEKAAQIAYRNLSVYLGAYSQYTDARFYSIQSAIDLYGDCSDEVVAVTNAWYAVGVGGEYDNKIFAGFESPTYGCKYPIDISFTNTSIKATSYNWDFGDGTTSTDKNPVHTYSAAGTYTVRLIASGIGMCNSFDTLIKQDIITIENSGQIAPASSSPEPLYPGVFGIYNFSFGNINRNSGDSSEGYEDVSCFYRTELQEGVSYPISITTSDFYMESVSVWIDFDNDGDFQAEELIYRNSDATVNLANVLIPQGAVYDTPLRLRVKSDSTGATYADSSDYVAYGQIEDYGVIIARNDQKPISDFYSSQNIISPGEKVDFFDRTQNLPTSWKWILPGADTDTMTVQNPEVTYDSIGDYDVVLITQNTHGSDTLILPNYVNVINEYTMCDTSYSSAQSGRLFDPGGKDGNYGNGELCEFLIQPSCIDTIFFEIDSIRMEGCCDYLRIYDGYDVSGILLASVNGTNNPGKLYATSGSMFVKFTTDGSGTYMGFEAEWSSSEKYSGLTPDATFSVSDTTPPYATEITFTDLSDPAAYKWVWNFDDGSTSTLQNPTHTYLTHGSYDVLLVSESCSGIDTADLTITSQLPPVMVASPDSIKADLFTGEKVEKIITIDNSAGSGDLAYSIEFSGTSTRVAPALKESFGLNNSNQRVSNKIEGNYKIAGEFSELADSPVPLTCLAIDPNTETIYGQANSGYNFYSYSPETGMWSSLKSCPINSGNNGGAVYHQGKIITSYTSSGSLGIYDIVTDSWTSVLAGVGTGNIASDGTYVYLAAGTSLYEVDITMGTNSLISTISPINFNMWGGLCYFDSKLYGHSGNGNQAFAVFDLQSQTWTGLPNIPGGAVLGAAIDPVNKRYFTYGSYSGNNFYSYDIDSAKWTTQAIPYFSVNDGGLVYNGKSGHSGIYFIEGESGTGFARYETSVSSWLSSDTTNGTVKAGDIANLTLELDATGLYGGIYASSILVTGNDPLNIIDTIGVKMSVTGAPYIDLTPSDSLVFDTSFVGFATESDLIISNIGTDSLIIDSIYFSSKYFSTNKVDTVVHPENAYNCSISFIPISAGSRVDTLYIANNSQDSIIKLPLFTNSLVPPKMELSVDSLVAELVTNDSLIKQFTIDNTMGGSNLYYTINNSVVKNMSVSSIQLPPVVSESVYLDGKQSHATALKEIESVLADLSGTNVAFYGGFPSSIMKDDLTDRGAITIEIWDVSTATLDTTIDILYINDNIASASTADLANIAVWVESGGSLVVCGDNSASMDNINTLIEPYGITESYTGFLDYMIDTFTDHPINDSVFSLYSSSNGGLLTNTGTYATDLYLDDSDNSLAAAINAEKGRIVVLTNEGESIHGDSYDGRRFINQTFDWLAFSGSSWLNIENSSGIIYPGTSETIDVLFDASGLYGGDYYSNLIISGNDPANLLDTIGIRLNVTGTPILNFGPADSLVFDSSYVGYPVETEFSLYNLGTDNLAIDSLYFNAPFFNTLDIDTVLYPNQSYTGTVSYTSSIPETRVDTMYVKSNCRDSVLKVPLFTISLIPPVMVIDVDSLTADLFTNDSIVQQFTIDNTAGGSELYYTVTAENYLIEASDSIQLSAITVNSIDEDNNKEISNKLNAINGVLADLTGINVAFYNSTEYSIASDLEARGANVIILYDLEPITLNSIDILYFDDNIAGLSSAYLANVITWVESGGSLILCGDDSGSMDEINTIIDSYNVTESYTGSGSYIVENFESHPVNDSIFRIYTSSHQSIFTNTGTEATNLFYNNSGSILAVAIKANSGRIVAVGNELSSIFSDGYDGRRFINQVYDWLAGKGGASWLKINPLSGSVPAGSSETIDVLFDASGVYGGEYFSNIVIESNCPVTPIDTIGVRMSVEGVPIIETLPKHTLYFDTAYVGNGVYKWFTIRNSGTDDLIISDVFFNSDKYSSTLSRTVIPANDTATCIIYYESDEVESNYDTIYISNNSNESIKKLTLSTVTLIPPKMEITPESFEFTILRGASESGTITIDNSDGGSNLWYSIRTTNDKAELEIIKSALALNYNSVLNGLENIYEFSGGESGYYIVDGGDNMFDNGNYLYTDRGAVYYSPDSIVNSTAFGITGNGRYFTNKYDGLFVLAADLDSIYSFYTNGNLGADGYGSVEGDVISCSVGGKDYNGYYKKVYGAGVPSVNHLIIIESNGNYVNQNYSYSTNTDMQEVYGYGVSNADRIYYLLFAGIEGQEYSETDFMQVMKNFLHNSGEVSWLKVTGAQSGSIAAGNLSEIPITIDTKNMQPGTYQTEIHIFSNDPDNSYINIPVSVEVLNGAELVYDTIISFESTPVNDVASKSLTIKNIGDVKSESISISFNDACFSTDLDADTTIEPGNSIDVPIIFTPGDDQNFNGMMNISCSNSMNDLYPVYLSGSGYYAYGEVNILPEYIYDSIQKGSTKLIKLYVHNTGHYNLDVAITVDESWIKASGILQNLDPDSYIEEPLLFDARELIPGTYYAFAKLSCAQLKDTIVDIPITIEVKGTTGIKEENDALSKCKVYPNPFNGRTTIQFSLENASQMAFKLYNSVGIQVAEIGPEWFPEGSSNAEFDGTDIPPGVYYLQLIQNNQIVKNIYLIRE